MLIPLRTHQYTCVCQGSIVSSTVRHLEELIWSLITDHFWWTTAPNNFSSRPSIHNEVPKYRVGSRCKEQISGYTLHL